MNKKEAIAYAQVTLNYMQSSIYNGELNPLMLGIEMKQCFKLYSKNLILNIANSQIESLNKIKMFKGSVINE